MLRRCSSRALPKTKIPVLKTLLKADSHGFASFPLSLKRSRDDPSKLNNSRIRRQKTENRRQISFGPAAHDETYRS